MPLTQGCRYVRHVHAGSVSLDTRRRVCKSALTVQSGTAKDRPLPGLPAANRGQVCSAAATRRSSIRSWDWMGLRDRNHMAYSVAWAEAKKSERRGVFVVEGGILCVPHGALMRELIAERRNVAEPLWAVSLPVPARCA
jgi:hypothetical protein